MEGPAAQAEAGRAEPGSAEPGSAGDSGSWMGGGGGGSGRRRWTGGGSATGCCAPPLGVLGWTTGFGSAGSAVGVRAAECDVACAVLRAWACPALRWMRCDREGSRRRRRGGLGPGDRVLLRRRRAHVRRPCLQRLVSDARDEEPSCEHRRHLGADAESADSDAAACSTAEERGERSGKRDRAQMIQRGPLCALTALEGRAVLAFAEVRPQRSAIRTRELALLEAGERVFRFVAGESALELLAESSAGAEHQGLDCGDRDVEHVGDLGVRTAFELAHDEGGALVEGEEAQGAADLVRGRDVGVLGCRGCVRVVELDLAGAARRVAEALSADVVRDLDQPVVRRVRALTALEGAVGVEEGRLGDVLRVGLVVEDGEGVAVDGVDVLAVEPLEGAVSGATACCEERGHRRLDAACAQILRFAPGHRLWVSESRYISSSFPFGTVA